MLGGVTSQRDTTWCLGATWRSFAHFYLNQYSKNGASAKKLELKFIWIYACILDNFISSMTYNGSQNYIEIIKYHLSILGINDENMQLQ